MASKNQIIFAKEIKINFMLSLGVVLFTIILYGILYVSKMPPLVPDYKEKIVKYYEDQEKARKEQIEFRKKQIAYEKKYHKDLLTGFTIIREKETDEHKYENDNDYSIEDIPVPQNFFPNGTIEYDNGLSYDDTMNGKINEHRMKRFYDDIMTISQNIFFILLIGLIAGRYILLSVKWVIRTSKIDIKQ